MSTDFSKLKRARYPMLDFIKQALREHAIMPHYQKRPAYQQNNYLGWITRTKREQTREKRLMQMIYELKAGNVYMGMKYSASSKI